MWRSWGRLRPPPVADTGSNKEWRQLGDRQVSHAHADRAVVATGSALADAHFNYNRICRDVAQLVARLLWEQDAAGSSPVISTIIAYRIHFLSSCMG